MVNSGKPGYWTHQLEGLLHLWMFVGFRLAPFSDPDTIHLCLDVPEEPLEFSVVAKGGGVAL